MSVSLLLEMAVSADPDRVAVVDAEDRFTCTQLRALSDGGASVIDQSGARSVVYLGVGGAMLPLLIFAAARARRPLTPLNYRLSEKSLSELISRLPDPLIVVDSEYLSRVSPGRNVMTSADFLASCSYADPMHDVADAGDVAIVLFTSGTTSRPKAVELTHSNLTSYVIGTVEFASADHSEAALVCVPPYHIAGVGAAMSNVYAGRKIVYLPRFDPREWLRLVEAEAVTAATVVPTMLDRIVSVLETEPQDLSSLRTLAYGGSKVSLPLLRNALDLMPDVGFVNAYGLTETSSTVSVLTPEDHRIASSSADAEVSRRLASVGRPVPGVEVQVRAGDGSVLAPGETGELFVRGPQVSGHYQEIGSVLDEDGWFPTKDVAMRDDAGYLFLGGRSDDTIIRGGENIAPSEIEDVLVEHPLVHEVVVVGVEDREWGQIIVAVVVPEPGADPAVDDLITWARTALRGSRTPDRIVFRDQLPVTSTGKVLRRLIVEELEAAPSVKR
ncbi:Long-chain-fatty-acid--CoA ligase [Mycolicibacterium vanbaalenii]|uniref:Long-chain-fatty-acid--CoA ligase n=1 Tax=Mycolicibacterium vanbaalenii TaxID=110539 RepID=A0A5S9RCX6_MYCVN|nr:fatty acid--CoA ligase family protein [Mycolicibacterium vanbaalenii]CAA0137674.1 Long-chain-fatty-acid--CoA ligase [Mycolicibacterium vanbaalenii]